jgi:hypothetical protein
MAWSPQLDYRTEGGRVRGARPVTCNMYMHMYVTLAGKGKGLIAERWVSLPSSHHLHLNTDAAA